MITIQQLKDSMPGITDKNITKYLPELNKSLPANGIVTPLRLSHFLAQVGHESLSFLYYRELASGAAYEGRKDLGNTEPGDGVKFRGRGAIQITGRNNYKAVSLFIFNDLRLLDTPELLELPENGIKAACWFWTTRKLNNYADADDLLTITRRINGGTNGLEDRKNRLLKTKKAFGL
jgi:putative chitinase